MRTTLTRPVGVMSLAVLEVFAALLLIAISVLLVDLALLGLAGAGVLAIFGLIEFVLGLLSFAETAGLWMAKAWSWILTIALSTVAILLNVGLLGLAATLTLTVLYPGGPVVLLILANDIIIAELAVVYFLAKPNIRSYLGRAI